MRKTTAKDAVQSATLLNEPDIHHWLLHEGKTKPKKPKKDGAKRLCVEQDGKIVGLIGFRPDLERNSHCARFWIAFSKAAQGTGLAETIFRTLFPVLQKEGIELLYSGVFSDNLRARRFYEKLGFKEYGRLPRGLKRGKKYFDEIFVYKKL
ncbi:MAG: GNAT family N-acetyltransferase [Candidatus Micrarchaeota archaeon]